MPVQKETTEQPSGLPRLLRRDEPAASGPAEEKSTHWWKQGSEEIPDEDVPAEEKTRQLLVELNSAWGKRYRQLTEEFMETLVKDWPDATGGERLLLRLAASQGVLADVVGKGQLAMAERATTAVDARGALALAKALRELALTNAAIIRRAQELVQAVSTMRVQSQLASSLESSPT